MKKIQGNCFEILIFLGSPQKSKLLINAKPVKLRPYGTQLYGLWFVPLWDKIQTQAEKVGAKRQPSLLGFAILSFEFT